MTWRTVALCTSVLAAFLAAVCLVRGTAPVYPASLLCIALMEAGLAYRHARRGL